MHIFLNIYLGDGSDDGSRAGSVIYNRNTQNKMNKNLKSNGMSALQDGDEDAPDDNSKPNFNKSRSRMPNGKNIQQNSKPKIKKSNSALEVYGTNPNNKKQNESNSKSKSNLKTKETRLQPPPGFGVESANLNPGYNPQLNYKNQGANMQNQPNALQWKSSSTNNLGTYGNNNNNNNQQQIYTNMNKRQVSPFVSATNINQQQTYNPAQAFQKIQWAHSAVNMNINKIILLRKVCNIITK